MNYNPDKHNRRSIRLKGYDYSQPGVYYVTLCVSDRQCCLGRIEKGQIKLSGIGGISDK
jgi:putative transposase